MAELKLDVCTILDMNIAQKPYCGKLCFTFLFKTIDIFISKIHFGEETARFSLLCSYYMGVLLTSHTPSPSSLIIRSSACHLLSHSDHHHHHRHFRSQNWAKNCDFLAIALPSLLVTYGSSDKFTPLINLKPRVSRFPQNLENFY